MSNYIWEMVDADGLPIYIADTRRELAKIVGVNEVTISKIMKYDREHGIPCRYVKVYVGDEDE